MTVVAIYLVITFGLGGLALALRLPPLVGFLAAGFVINALHVGELPQLETLADLGVTLLLFAIGLKLDVRILLRREVWLTASAHMVISVVLGGGVLWLAAVAGVAMLAGQSVQTIALLAFALSFSSTVFVVKILEERGESHALYGRVAIGILVMQDIIAVVFLTATSGHLPSPWALTLVGLWPLTRVLRKIWGRLGHGEMQSLFGIVMALVPGYALFSAVGLKGDLGALIVGVLLASHPASSELARSLFHIKELLLVGFFVSIGLTGLPDLPTVGVAVLMVLLLPFKGAWYVLLLTRLNLRYRTAILAGLGLMNYSEFGLIVVSVGVSAGLLAPAWLVEMSIAVALSFVVSALLNGRGHLMVEKVAARLPAPRGAPRRRRRCRGGGDRHGPGGVRRLPATHRPLPIPGRRRRLRRATNRATRRRGVTRHRGRRHRLGLLEPITPFRLSAHRRAGDAASRRQRHRP